MCRQKQGGHKTRFMEGSCPHFLKWSVSFWRKKKWGKLVLIHYWRDFVFNYFWEFYFLISKSRHFFVINCDRALQVMQCHIYDLACSSCGDIIICFLARCHKIFWVALDSLHEIFFPFDKVSVIPQSIFVVENHLLFISTASLIISFCMEDGNNREGR